MSASTIEYRVQSLEESAFGWTVAITHVGANGQTRKSMSHGDRICKAVCEHSDISIKQLLSKKRTRVLCDARFTAALLMRETRASYPYIAIMLRYRSHRSAMNAVRKGRDFVSTDSYFAQTVNLVRGKISVDSVR